MKNEAKFRSTTGQVILVANTMGHAARVGPEWRDLPVHLHDDALATRGIECDQGRVGMAPQRQAPKAGPKAAGKTDAESAIRDALGKMIVRNKKGDFTADGQPNRAIVVKIAGTNASKELIQKVFAAMKAEAEAEGDEAEGDDNPPEE